MSPQIVPTQYMFPLGMAIEGERVKVIRIQGQKELIRRLASIGLVEDVEIHVIQKGSAGVVVLHGETRWAVDAGTARKIFVIPAAKIHA